MTKFDAEEGKLGDGNRRARRDGSNWIRRYLSFSLPLPSSLCLSFSFCVSLSQVRDDNDTQTLSDLFQPARTFLKRGL